MGKTMSTKCTKIKDKLQEEYQQLDKEVKTSTQMDEREYTEKLAEEAEKAAVKHIPTNRKTCRKIPNTKPYNYRPARKPTSKRGRHHETLERTPRKSSRGVIRRKHLTKSAVNYQC
jgi:hypothetical protein